MRIAYARFSTNPFQLDRPSHLTVYLDQMLDASQLLQWHCIVLIIKRKHIQKKGEIDGNIYSIVAVLSHVTINWTKPDECHSSVQHKHTHTRSHIHLNIYFIWFCVLHTTELTRFHFAWKISNQLFSVNNNRNTKLSPRHFQSDKESYSDWYSRKISFGKNGPHLAPITCDDLF